MVRLEWEKIFVQSQSWAFSHFQTFSFSHLRFPFPTGKVHRFRPASQTNQLYLCGHSVSLASAHGSKTHRSNQIKRLRSTSHTVQHCLMNTLICCTSSWTLLGGSGVTHRWTLGMPIKTFNESGRASKQQSGQTRWTPRVRAGPQTAAFGFSAHLIHLSVWLLGGKPSLRPKTRSTLWNHLNDGWLKNVCLRHVCPLVHGDAAQISISTTSASGLLGPSLWIRPLSRQTSVGAGAPTRRWKSEKTECRIYNTCPCAVWW